MLLAPSGEAGGARRLEELPVEERELLELDGAAAIGVLGRQAASSLGMWPRCCLSPELLHPRRGDIEVPRHTRTFPGVLKGRLKVAAVARRVEVTQS